MTGLHRIEDDLDHEPGWVDFAIDELVQEIGRFHAFEAWADERGAMGDDAAV